MKIIIRSIVENGLSGTKAVFQEILNFVFNQKAERKKMENQKSKSTFSAILMSLTLGVAVFLAGPAAAQKKYVTDPTTGKVVSAPEYGGTITFALALEPDNADTGFHHYPAIVASGVVERLGIADWAVERDVFDFRTSYIPAEILRGQLAERWETPDPLTYIFHIRQGVHWHAKAPLKSRALTAKDVEYNFHRHLGLGSGFTEKSEGAAVSGVIDDLGIESVTAEGSTVVFRLAKLNFDALKGIFIDGITYVYPPEVIEAHGAVTDWRNLVGTGPLMLTDWTEGSSISWEKNPDYWGFDEKYPQNRLPYIDKLRALVMPESATQLAALRSGRVEVIGNLGASQIRTIDQAESLKRTNPDIVLSASSFRSETSFGLNQRKTPMNDIRVRHALQLALDLETINKTYWQGWADITPQEFLGPAMLGYATPFEEWPEEIKRNYTYDPQRAERLLDEAGYPRGSDGIRFSTTLEPIASWDHSFFELAIEFFGRIGVEVKMINTDGTNWSARVREHKYDGLISYIAGFELNPLMLLQFVSTNEWNPTGAQDPEMDRLWAATQEATTLEEYQRRVREANQYATAQHWILWGGRVPQFSANQPWLKGYNGETTLGGMDGNMIFSRLWIDQELKKEMGF